MPAAFFAASCTAETETVGLLPDGTARIALRASNCGEADANAFQPGLFAFELSTIPLNFTPLKGRSYTVTVDMNAPSGDKLSHTLTLNAT